MIKRYSWSGAHVACTTRVVHACSLVGAAAGEPCHQVAVGGAGGVEFVVAVLESGVGRGAAVRVRRLGSVGWPVSPVG